MKHFQSVTPVNKIVNYRPSQGSLLNITNHMLVKIVH